MDLNSYIQLKEAYTQVGKPQQLTESVDSIWEEVEAFAHALVEEEGIDLSDMTWDEVREAYLEERMGRVSNSSQNTSGQAAQAAAKLARTAAVNTSRQNATGQGGKSIASNPNRRGVQPAKRPADMQKGKVYGDASPSPAAKPAPTQTAKPKPQAAKAAPSPMISDLKKRMPKPAAPKPAASKPSGSSYTGNRASSFMSKSGGAAAASKAPKPSASPIKSNRLRAALDSVKKEEFSEFDLILSHLIEQGFGDDEALKLMVNMTEEKRQEILQLDELSKKTMGSYVKKASKDVEKRSYDQGSTDAEDAEIGLPGQTPKDKKIGKRQKGIGKAVDKMTRKEEDESLYQAYLSMMNGGEQLDEISKKLARSYVNKSIDHQHSLDKKAYAKGTSEEDGIKALEKSDKRDKGISMAHDKLYKGTPNEIERNKKIKVTATGKDPAHNYPKEKSKGVKGFIKKLTRKEEDESLYQAYLSMMSEEESDKRKDKHLERGGHAARTDYSKPPATGNTFGKKKPMSDEDRSAAMAKVVAKLKKQGGK